MKDWVPNFGYGVPAAVDITTGARFVIPLVGTGLGVDPSGSQVGFPDTDPEEVTIHRTVGQFECSIAGIGEPSDGQVALRFTTAMYNQTFGAVFPFTVDLDDGADANEQFLYERRWRQGLEHTYNDGIGIDPNWSYYDIRSKRKLMSGEWLVCVVDVTQAAAVPAVMSFRHWFRSWVTTK